MSLRDCYDQDGPHLLSLHRDRNRVSYVKGLINFQPVLTHWADFKILRNFGFRCTTGGRHPTGPDTDRQLA